MILQIKEDLRIEADNLKWQIQENRPTKDTNSKNFGKENWVSCGEYSKIEQAFNAILNIEFKKIGDCDLEKFIKESEKIKKDLIKKFNL